MWQYDNDATFDSRYETIEESDLVILLISDSAMASNHEKVFSKLKKVTGPAKWNWASDSFVLAVGWLCTMDLMPICDDVPSRLLFPSEK